MDWSGLFIMLLSSVWTLILTAKGSIGEKVMLNFSKSVLMKKQTILHLGCPEGRGKDF